MMKPYRSVIRSALLRYIALSLAVTALFFSNGTAQDRLMVGFTEKQSLSSLALSKEWKSKGMGQLFWPLVYDLLWYMGPAPDYSPLPGIADRWETDDHQTWRFFLNEYAQFSDEIPVTAADVAFSLKLFLSRKDGWNPRGITIKSMTELDTQTLEVTLFKPHSGRYPPFYQIPILPRHFWKRYERQPETYQNRLAVGSGAYFVIEFKAGEILRLGLNRKHSGHGARWNEVVFLSFKNEKALHGAMLSGMIDMFGAQGLDPALVNEFNEARGIRAVVTEGLDLYWLSFNLAKNGPIRKQSVRQAIMAGIDREEIISRLYKGYATAADSFVYPELTGYHPDLKSYPFDQQKASRLLEQAGYSDFNGDGMRDDPSSRQDLTVSLLVVNNDLKQIQIARYIKKHLNRLGIRVDTMQVNNQAYTNFLNNPFESGHDLALGHFAPGPYQDWIWNMMRSDEDFYSQHNYSNYINYAFDRIYDRLLTTSRLDRKIKYQRLVQQIMAEDLPYGVLIRPYKICPLNVSKIREPVVSMGGISSEINLWNYIYPIEG